MFYISTFMLCGTRAIYLGSLTFQGVITERYDFLSMITSLNIGVIVIAMIVELNVRVRLSISFHKACHDLEKNNSSSFGYSAVSSPSLSDTSSIRKSEKTIKIVKWVLFALLLCDIPFFILTVRLVRFYKEQD